MAAKWTLYWSFRNQCHDTSTELLQSFDVADAGAEVKEVAGLYGDTLLHIACQNGWPDVVKQLIEKHGCDPEVKDRGKQTPLHYACHYGRLDVIHYLVQVQKCDIDAVTPDRWTPFYYAFRYGHLNIVEYFINIPGVTSCIDQQAVLQLTCEYGHIDILLYLMTEHGFIPQDTPQLLRIACEHSYKEISQYLCSLLDNFQNMHVEEHKALFIFCCRNGLLDILKRLSFESRHASILQFIDKFGKSGLHYACQEGHADVVKYLVEECGCDINVCDRDGLTPLHLACKHGHNVDIVKYLLSRSECNSLVRTNDGNTALHFACTTTQFNPKIIEILLKNGAIVGKGTLSLVNNISISSNVVKPAILSSLLEVANCDVNTRNYAGVSPIHLATYPFIVRETIAHHAEMEFHKLMEYSDEQRAIEKIQEYVRKNKGNLNRLAASNGDTILHIACVANKVDIVAHLLLCHNSNPNIKNDAGETPLRWALKHYAYKSSMSDANLTALVHLFVENSKWKPSLKEVDDDGNSILHLACQTNQLNLVKLLLPRAKHDHPLLLVINNNGYTPFELMTSPNMIVDGLMSYNLANDYTFRPGFVQQFIWFCKNIDTRRLKLFINNHQYTIKWEHKKTSDCCTRCFILHLPGHHSFCVLLEVCFCSEGKEISSEINISDECTPCYVTKLVGFLEDSSLESYRCNEELLHAACKQNKYHFVNYLLSTVKCDPNYCYDDVTPFHLTTSPDIMQLLVQHGASIPFDDIDKVINSKISTNNAVITNFISSLKLHKENGKWHPDSKCNSKGDTALHLSVRYRRFKLTKHLLTEIGCDPNIRNFENKLPLDLATNSEFMQILIQNGAKTRSENIKKLFYITTKEQPISLETLQVLVRTKQWHANSVYTIKHDTALHLSARHCRPEVAHFLLSEVKCDPNIKNVDDETFISLLMSIWSDSEIINTIKDLMTIKQWDPNSICNSKGDTALHLSARHCRPEIAHFLLSEVKCNPNIKNVDDETFISLLMSIWSDSEIINTIKDLMTIKQWDPNSNCTPKGDTALHLSARHCRPEVAHFLLSEVKCNPNIKNIDDETFISLLMSIWSDSEIINTIKDLMTIKQWDPNSNCTPKGDTALHLSARHCRPEVAHFLLSEVKCNPNIKNVDDETFISLLMSIWSDSEIINTIKDLMTIKQWDPNSNCTPKGDTALHLSARHCRPEVAHFLLSEVKCNPNIKNVDDETFISLLMSIWSDSEIINTIKDLMTIKQWDPNSNCTPKGDTALHLSARHCRPEVAHFLLSEVKCNPNIKNVDDETFISLLMSIIWSDSEIINTIKDLMTIKQWDPNSNCTPKGDTALHLSVRYHRPKVTQFLLSECACNPVKKKYLQSNTT